MPTGNVSYQTKTVLWFLTESLQRRKLCGLASPALYIKYPLPQTLLSERKGISEKHDEEPFPASVGKHYIFKYSFLCTD